MTSGLDSFLGELETAKTSGEAWSVGTCFLNKLGLNPPEAPALDWLDQVAGWSWSGDAPRLSSKNEMAARIAVHYLRQQIAGLALSGERQAVSLTHREREALAWVARGLNSKAAARKMGTMPKTIDLHVENARKKLDAATRIKAVAKAIKLGLIPAP